MTGDRLMKSCLIFLGLAFASVAVLMLALAGNAQSPRDAAATPAREAPELADLAAKLDALRQEHSDFKEQISLLSRTSPPIGTVMAFAGEWPPRMGEDGQWGEDDLGWMLCDGRSLALPEYSQLKQVLGTDRAPDLRARFLRGVDFSIDGEPVGLDEEGVRKVGSAQDDSTALPRPRIDGTEDVAKFRTNEEPEHDLSRRETIRWPKAAPLHFNLLLARTPNALEDSRLGTASVTDFSSGEPFLFRGEPIKKVPAHSHTIEEGGNKETRPVNVAVFWIIKFKSGGD